MERINILAIGRDVAILAVVERLINSHEGWKATVVVTEEEAMEALAQGQAADKAGFRIVFVCAGVTAEEEEGLRQKIGTLYPGVVVTRHYGGGSGLLENEVLAILNTTDYGK